MTQIRQRHLGSEGLGHLGKGVPRPRSYGVHNRAQQKISAACAKGNHYGCFSLNCTCPKCGHRRAA